LLSYKNWKISADAMDPKPVGQDMLAKVARAVKVTEMTLRPEHGTEVNRKDGITQHVMSRIVHRGGTTAEALLQTLGNMEPPLAARLGGPLLMLNIGSLSHEKMPGGHLEAQG